MYKHTLKNFSKEELSEIDKDLCINIAEYSYVLEKVIKLS